MQTWQKVGLGIIGLLVALFVLSAIIPSDPHIGNNVTPVTTPVTNSGSNNDFLLGWLLGSQTSQPSYYHSYSPGELYPSSGYSSIPRSVPSESTPSESNTEFFGASETQTGQNTYSTDPVDTSNSGFFGGDSGVSDSNSGFFGGDNGASESNSGFFGDSGGYDSGGYDSGGYDSGGYSDFGGGDYGGGGDY